MDEQRVLGGRYLLKDKVGNGGMATVYRAQDQVLDRMVAVKIMLPQYAGDPTFAARFKQEAQAAAGLSSPYIVGVYDWGRDGDTYYIVMEYLRGTDLKSGIRSHGALDPKKVAQIGAQICGALSVAHKHEIIHRDIKPQNIMVLPDGNIKVMDFGIARGKNSHLTQDNNVLGTAHYVSPEQTRGQELAATSDIYSLGVVMYECATGQVPFDGDDAISVALKQVNELSVPPSQINPGVDANLERIILRCMEKDPAARPQSADELRQLLNAYLSGRSVDVPEPTRVIAAAGMDATTRVMGDATQAMVRPNVAAGQTVTGGAAGRMGSGNPASTSASQFESAQKDGLSKGKIAGIVAAIIAVIAIAVFAVSGMLSPAKQVSVPNVLGQDQKTAVAAIREANLEAGDITVEYSDTVEEGKVISQDPAGNTKADEGSKVNLVVSKGEEPAKTVKVPNLEGMSRDQARNALEEVGLVSGDISEEPSDQFDEGQVFGQSIDAGSEVEEGSSVDFKVSTGTGTESVPGVLGMTYAQASNKLTDLGFSVERIDDYSDEYTKGQVMAQSVTGSAKKGDTITLTVSLGKKDTSVDVDSLGLVGMTQADAESAIATAGLRYNSVQRSNANAPAGTVASYSPKGKQKEGTTVTIIISTGPESGSGDTDDVTNGN